MEAAKSELAKLPAARSVAEVEAVLGAAQRDPSSVQSHVDVGRSRAKSLAASCHHLEPSPVILQC